MTDFQNRRPIPDSLVATICRHNLSFLVAMAVLLSFAVATFAQGVTTQPLQPSPLPSKSVAPRTPTSLTPTTPPKNTTVPKKTPNTKSSLVPATIDVEALDATDKDSIGILGGEEGGFGLDMWAGTRRSLVEILLPAVPAQSPSRIMRTLLRRLLLSTAKAPPTTTVADAPNIRTDSDAAKPAQKRLIHMRIERLSAMGDIGAVDDLLKVAPNREADQVLLRSQADVLFYGNDYARVCPLVASQIRRVATVYWRKAFIFCQALDGEHERASLGVTLLQEQGEEDLVFFNLIDALAGLEKANIESMSNPRPLHFAMARAAKARLPGDVISSNHPAVLKTVARAPGLHPELRIDAAERAEAMGALQTRIMRDLYTGVPFSQEMLENPLTTAESERSPLSRALLYRKALVESIPTAKAGIVSQALSLARDGGGRG